MGKLRSDVVIKLIISVVLVSGLFFSFAPWLSVSMSDVKESVNEANIKSGMSESGFYYTEAVDELFFRHDLSNGESPRFNAFQMLMSLSDAERKYDSFLVDDYSRLGVRKLSVFVHVVCLTTWITASIGVICMWLVKTRRAHVWAIVCYSISLAAMLSSLLIPYFLKINLVAYLAGDSHSADVYSSYHFVSAFGRMLFLRSLSVGYWYYLVSLVASMGLAIAGYIRAVAEDNKLVVATVRHVRNVGAIIFEAGVYEGSSLAITEPVIIGRDAQVSQIVVEKPEISRKHCVVEFNRGAQNYIVTDSSSNGTFVEDGERLKKNIPTIVESGTRIRLGDGEEVFRLD